jgi:hypothetical protein
MEAKIMIVKNGDILQDRDTGLRLLVVNPSNGGASDIRINGRPAEVVANQQKDDSAKVTFTAKRD